jgi:type I restriction enzyme, R subunit
MEKKNPGLQALRKLLNDEVWSCGRSNVIERWKFSERLEGALRAATPTPSARSRFFRS